MDLHTWLNSTDEIEREKVAIAAGTSVGYLWQISGNHSKASWHLAKRLEKASKAHTPKRILSKEALRPDIWS